MKDFILKSLRYTLKQLARLTIWRFRPGIVCVTGSVGKTTTKLAIAAVLESHRPVRWSKGNLNNDFGVPLTILGDWSDDELKLVSRATPAGTDPVKKALFWLKVILVSLWRVFLPKRANYPEILVLEYGADRPGDIKYLLSIARPNVSVITAVGDVPSHVEFFASPADLAREKARLIECLPVSGYAVLNADDPIVMNLHDRTRAHILTFGFGKKADVRVMSYANREKNGRPLGVGFKLDYGGGFVPVQLEGTFGKGQAYAASAAANVGLVFGMNLIRISEALSTYAPAKSRMQLREGIKETWLIDDTYNANPASTEAALETLEGAAGARKIAVLGDMLEIGKYSLDSHTAIGTLVSKIADILVTVGPHGKFIAEGAKAAGLDKRKVHWFETTEEAVGAVPKLIQKGDTVLLKASRGMHFEDIVQAIEKV